MTELDGNETLTSYRNIGLGMRSGFGQRPAIVVVDASIGFTSTESPMGGDFDSEIAHIRELLDVARTKHLPIVFSTVVYDETMQEAGVFYHKVPALKLLQRGTKWVELDERLARRPEELLLEKHFASCFFGTSLASFLMYRQVDTLIVTGFTTSGCVRATAVDAMQNGLRTVVPVECVGDRSLAQHASNLIDLEGKYGDVLPLEQVLLHLRSSVA